MFVCDPADLQITKFVVANWTVNQCVCIQTVQGVMVKMRVGTETNVNVRVRKIMKEPVGLTCRKVSPRVNHDG